MTQGIHAEITADASQYGTAIKNASLKTTEFKQALNQVNQGLIKFKPSAQTAQASMQRFNAATKKTTSNFRAMKGATQQLGFQVQDIAVQLAGGQNAMVVFGQQGSQIASLFGPGGAVVGAVLAVAAAVGTALVPALMSGSREMDNMVKSSIDLGNRLRTMSADSLKDELFKAEAALFGVQSEINRVRGELDITDEGSFEGIRMLNEELDRLTAKKEDVLGTIHSINQAQAQAFAREAGGAGDDTDEIKKLQDRETLKGKIAAENWIARWNAEQEREKLRIKIQAEQHIAEFERQQAFQDALVALEDEKYNERAQNLRDFLSGQQGEYEHNANALVEITRRQSSMQNAAVVAGLASTAKSLATHNKKAFEINKAFAISDAVVSAYQGISKTLATYPFPISAAMAAAQAAMAFAQIQQIKSQSFGGGAGGGAVAGGGAGATPGTAAAPQQTPENQIVNIDLQGEVFGRDQVRGLIGQINEALDDGYTLRV